MLQWHATICCTTFTVLYAAFKYFSERNFYAHVTSTTTENRIFNSRYALKYSNRADFVHVERASREILLPCSIFYSFIPKPMKRFFRKNSHRKVWSQRWLSFWWNEKNWFKSHQKCSEMDSKNQKIKRPKRQQKVIEDYWDCSVCTFSNSAEAFKCLMCDVRKGKVDVLYANSHLTCQMIEEMDEFLDRTIENEDSVRKFFGKIPENWKQCKFADGKNSFNVLVREICARNQYFRVAPTT